MICDDTLGRPVVACVPCTSGSYDLRGTPRAEPEDHSSHQEGKAPPRVQSLRTALTRNPCGSG
eukprot:1712418-Prymnesium_polylepis.2